MTAKMTKDFDFWREVMFKKVEWEKSNGKIEITNRKVNETAEIAERINSAKNKIFADLNKK
jgi:hypothetical protein